MNILEKIEYIENYSMDPLILKRVQKEYGYSKYKIDLLVEVLKDYFIAHALREHKQSNDFITMASFHVDQLWHWFILFTPQYREFCDKVYGKYLDHIPTTGVVPTKTHKDETYFHTVKYLKEIKTFRQYKNEDLIKLNKIESFYSIFTADYIICNMSFEDAINKSLDDLDIL